MSGRQCMQALDIDNSSVLIIAMMSLASASGAMPPTPILLSLNHSHHESPCCTSLKTAAWCTCLPLLQDKEHKITFTIPIFEPISSQYFVKLAAMDWLYAEAQVELNLHKIVLPVMAGAHTDLLDLSPLPRSALKNETFERMYDARFTHFNPIQTQAFHVLYHTDESVLLGAPTGAPIVLPMGCQGHAFEVPVTIPGRHQCSAPLLFYAP
jgi:hypothetical protein